MDLDHDVRAALKPLDDEGLIDLVEVDASLVGVGATPNPLATMGIMIRLNTLDPEAHREEIEHLLHEHGLKNIEVVLETNPPPEVPEVIETN
jgi:hypothetical protein